MKLFERFVQRYPEFSETDGELVAAVLDEAKLEIDPYAWGDKYLAGLLLLAAHKLACSPVGEPMRLEPGSGSTMYSHEFERLKNSLCFTALVA